MIDSGTMVMPVLLLLSAAKPRGERAYLQSSERGRDEATRHVIPAFSNGKLT